MARINLYVPPEDQAATGAEEPEEFNLVSDTAFVASAVTACLHCHEEIEVICIYCDTGMDPELGELLLRFAVSNIWAMDGVLAAQLERWPSFRRVSGLNAEDACFANHCPNCGAAQDDTLLHSEPGDVFFGIVMERPEAVKFTPLSGRIQLCGDYGFELIVEH